MADLYDGIPLAPAAPAAAPPLTAPPPAPRAPAGMYDGLELAPAQPRPTAPPQREAKGAVESMQAGFQASAPGLLWRGRLPELVINPETAAWWERALSGFAQVGSELPIMIPAAMAGAPAGAAAGSAIAGPGPGTVGGSLLGAGFAMGAVPAGIRESLIQSYKSGETKTPEDWFNIVREVAGAMLKEGGINAVSMGAGGLAGRAVSKAIAPSIGTRLAVPVERVGSRSAQISTAGTLIETADLTTQIATMVAMPAALQGRLPTAQEFLDAAILVGGLKTAHVTAQKMTDVYRRTGRTPAEQVADAQADPRVAEDLLAAAARPPVDPLTGTASGVPVKLDKILAEAEFLARGGVPEAPNIRAIIQEIKDAGPQQGDMIADIERIGALHDAARQKPLTDPERAELEALRARVADSDAIRRRIEAGEAPEAPPARFEPDQLTDAQARAKARVDELAAKSEAGNLTDAERAERVMLTNAKPEALARHFGLEPVGPRRITAEAAAASARRVHDDVLAQLRAADAARQEAGNPPLGDDHAQAVAALVLARVRTRAARLGMLPEEIYAENALKIRAEGEAKVAAAEIVPDAPIEAPPDAPTFIPPEVDLFGNPVPRETAPRYAVENMATVEVPLAGLVLSKEVPQFKHAADAEGVVVPLGGKFDRTGVGPIQVWERLNGAMEVISGRHRLDLARRSGEKTIPAQVHREADGFDARQAAILDAQLNIREEQGSVADYVQYFKDSGITREAADERGLLARAKGRTAFAIARDASPDLAAAHRAGVLSDEAALSISTTAPGSERLQALGMAMVQEGKSILVATNTMRAVDLMAAERMAAGKQGDIFGFDDSAMIEAGQMAKRASSIQRRIGEQISAVSGASRRPELARKMGVDVADPQGIQKRIVELKQEQTLWDNWPMHPELVARLRAPEVTGRENELMQRAIQDTHPDVWADAPRNEAEYVLDTEIYNLESNPYVNAAGLVTANSRATPNPNTFPPVGTWRISTLKLSYGREIEQLVALPIDKLVLGELDSQGRLDPVKAGDEKTYAQWLAEGKRPPPINVVQTDGGRLNVTDGHRRALAAKLAGATTVEAWVNYAVPIPSGGRDAGRPDGKLIRTGMTYEMLTGEVPNPFMDRMPLYQDVLKPETPAEAAARDAEATAQALRRLEREAAQRPVQPRAEFERVLKQHGEDAMSGRNTRVSNETAERLAKEGHPDAGTAALAAYITDDFSKFTGKNADRNPAAIALAEHLKTLPPDRTGMLFRVMGFQTERARNAFIAKVQKGQSTAIEAERVVSSFTEIDPRGKTAWTHPGIDQASIQGPHQVVIAVRPRAGNKTMAIGSDVSYAFGRNSRGVDVLVPAGTQFKVVGVQNMDAQKWVVLEPVKERTDGATLFQDEAPGPIWYSALARSVEFAQMASAPAKGWRDFLKGQTAKGAVKADEIKWSGLDEWLAMREAEGGKITRDEVAAFLEQNGVRVTEVEAGIDRDALYMAAREEAARFGITGDLFGQTWGRRSNWRAEAPGEEFPYSDTDVGRKLRELIEPIVERRSEQTKFSIYQLPGAKEGSYRELLLTLPAKAATFDQARYNDLQEQHRATVDRVVEARKDLEESGDQRYVEELRELSRKRNAIRDEMTLMEIDRDKSRKAITFNSSHFPQDNILAHVRFNERTDADGKRVLFLEEIQSDWAQKGKKEGFSVPDADKRMAEMVKQYDTLTNERRAALNEAEALPGDGGDKFVALLARADEISKRLSTLDGEMADLRAAAKSTIPAAPFVGKTDAWVALALKRMIRYAAENGFDRVAWTTGEQQVSRYTSALRKQVDAIEWTKTPEGVQLVGYKGKAREGSYVSPGIEADALRALAAHDNLGFDTPMEARDAVLQNADWQERWDVRDSENARQIDNWRRLKLAVKAPRQKVVDTTEKETALSDAIGKAMAERILKDPNQTGVIEGDGIKIDDTGMASFYDRIVPNVAKDVLKKLGGGKVGETSIAVDTAASMPKFGPLSPELAAIYGGAERFPGNGGPPGHAVATVRIDGRGEAVDVILDRNGITMITKDADPREFFVDWETTGQLPRTGIEALGRVEGMWSNRESEMWANLAPRTGEPAKLGPMAEERRQPAFDITPTMREKALEGLPLFQQHRGSFQVAENLVTIMAGADKSTVVHELSHSWLEEMKADASRPDAPAQLRADWETLRRELAIPESGEIPRASHEQFARSGERYLAEGDAPTPALQSVFARFREWLLEIYRDLRNLNVEINPDLRAVLDRMLATDEEIAAARELGVPRAYVEVAAAEQARQIVPGFKAEQVSMEPYADALPDGPGKAPDDSHVNYAYINTPLDVKLTMQRMAEIDQANIQKQRGGTDGVKSWAEANAEQAKYVNDILGGSEDTLKLLQPRDPDAPGPDVRLGILKKLAVGAAKDSARLRDIVLEAGHDATVRQQLEYMGSIERARMIQAEFLGERASVARALNALKDVTEGSGEIAKMLDAIGYGEAAARELFQAARSAADEQAFMRAKLDEILLNYKGKSVLDIARLHKEIGTLKGTYSFTKAVTQASKWEMVVEGWKASLLSGPVTHTTNLFGTGAFMALRAPVDALAAVIGVARGASPGMGESNRASMSEAVARLTGMLGGVGEGLRVAKATFDLDDPTGKTEAYRTAIPGRAGELIRVPLRLMGAEDALVSTMYRRGELATLAIRQAFDEGLNPATREFAERVDQLKDKPTPAMELAAEAAATRMTFNMPLGEKGVALQLFVNKWNLQWMIPFIRTPINITKEVARMSPFAPLVGEWRADMAKGGVARDRAIAEMTLGSGIMALTMAYAFAGQISGGGSADPGKNRGKAGVEQPYSIKIGDTWYEYARIQPTGTLMGMAADIATAWDHMTDEEKDKVPKLLARAFANAVTNQTFLQGITNVVNAMSEPARFAPKFLQQMAGSMVPNVIGQPTAMADPVVREVNGMLEAIQARIPGLRQDLLPKRDWLGAEVQTKERLGVVGPVREQKITDDKVRLEAARLDISMAVAPKKTHIGKGTGKLGDVELTPEERNLFQKIGGEMAHKLLATIVNAPGYDDIPDLVKRKIFAKVLTASHQMAAASALPMDKRLGYIQSITEKVTAELAPADQ